MEDKAGDFTRNVPQIQDVLEMVFVEKRDLINDDEVVDCEQREGVSLRSAELASRVASIDNHRWAIRKESAHAGC